MMEFENKQYTSSHAYQIPTTGRPQVSEAQVGPVLLGPGALKKKTFSLIKLTSRQREAVESAKKYAREQGIKAALLKQTITLQQKQTSTIQNSIQRQQALALMCRIYIGSINFIIKEEEVRQAFLPFGPIKSMTMPFDSVNNHHKGFAFLEYETPEAAFLSLELNGKIISGYSIKVGRPSNMPQAQPAIDKIVEESKAYNRIYISGIHAELNESDIKAVFEPFGNIKSCQLASDLLRPGRHKGYGYIEFEQPGSATDAVDAMNHFNLGGSYLRIGKAITPPAIPQVTSNSLPMASAIAAAAITAQITELEAIGVVPVESGSVMNTHPSVIIPALSSQ